MAKTTSLTSSDILAATTDGLRKSGYIRITELDQSFWDSSQTRLFEDEFGIVAVIVYETWESLETEWFDAQAALVELMTESIRSSDPKAWEGYLLLLSTGYAPSEDAIDQIRYDMSRVRKLVADGERLRTISDIDRILQPLIPIGDKDDSTEVESAIDMLPRLLAEQGIPEADTRVVIQGYRDNKPLLRELHNHLGSKQ